MHVELFQHNPIRSNKGATVHQSRVLPEGDTIPASVIIPSEHLSDSGTSQPGKTHFFVQLCANSHNAIVPLLGYSVIGQGALKLSLSGSEEFSFGVTHYDDIQTTCDILYEKT